MGQFENRDKIRDLDRRLSRAERELTRVPVTLPVINKSVPEKSVLLKRCEDGLSVEVEDVSLGIAGREDEKLSDLIGKVVLLHGDALLEESCWIVVSTSDCGGTLCPTVCDIMDNCDDCGGCYALVDCDSIQTDKIVMRSDICSFGFVVQPGDTVRLDDGTCWEVENTEYCEYPDTVVIESVSPSCSECGRCLEITRCGSSETKIIYKDDLGYSVGQVLKIKGECWEVTDEGECTGTPEHVPDTSPVYDDCAECGCYKLTPCDDPFPKTSTTIPSMSERMMEERISLNWWAR